MPGRPRTEEQKRKKTEREHSTENKAIKEDMMSVNSNNKSFHVASNFAAI